MIIKSMEEKKMERLSFSYGDDGVFFNQEQNVAIAIKFVVKLHLKHWTPRIPNSEIPEHWEVVAAYGIGNESHFEILYSSTNKEDAVEHYQSCVKRLSNFQK